MEFLDSREAGKSIAGLPDALCRVCLTARLRRLPRGMRRTHFWAAISRVLGLSDAPGNRMSGKGGDVRLILALALALMVPTATVTAGGRHGSSSYSSSHYDRTKGVGVPPTRTSSHSTVLCCVDLRPFGDAHIVAGVGSPSLDQVGSMRLP